MQTKEKQVLKKGKTNDRSARRTRTHILKRNILESNRIRSKATDRTYRNQSSAIVLPDIQKRINPIDVARLQDAHPIYGESSSKLYLKHVHSCLKYHTEWKDNNTWDSNTSINEVIHKLSNELKELLPYGSYLDYHTESNQLCYFHQYKHDGCMIPVSAFLPQLKEFNPSLYRLVATTISHISTRCGFSLWDGEIEYEAVDYIEQILADPEFYGLEDVDNEKELETELSRWQNVLWPYAQEIRQLSRETSIETIIDEVNNYDWPNTFTAKRVYLWFHRAFQLILSDFHVNSFTHYEPDEYEDGPPLLPEDTFKFTWPSRLDISINSTINTHIQEILNDRSGNFGVAPLVKRQQFKKGWNKSKYTFKELHNFCDSTVSLWLEPEFRDFFQLKSVETKIFVEKEYHRTYKYFKPVSWRPKLCTL